MRSIRGRLFVVLVSATAFIWLCASAWIFVQTRSEVEHVLDTRLQEAARMVSSLAVNGDSSATLALPDSAAARSVSYERQLSCQIWSLDGRLMARSSGAPRDSLGGGGDGFSNRQVDGETWRVFAVSDPDKNIRVLVGDRLGLRERLVTDLIRGLLWPALFIVPLLGALIWRILGRGLRPLQMMANDLTRRNVDDLSPLEVVDAPPELAPLAGSLNGLFLRVEAVRQHERDFTAFAAHELRTPLAGLKVQAQVALATPDAEQRERSLRNIILSVDRTSRLARQLLAVARLDTQLHVERTDKVDLGQIIAEIVSELPAKPDLRVTRADSLQGMMVTTNRDLLAIALRNLHENAVHHSNGPGEIVWDAIARGSRVELRIDDSGPGIPDAEMHLVTSRFFRGRHKSPSGSGLGLAIVDIALEKIGGSLELRNKTDGRGLRATVCLPV
ncbi:MULTISPECIES: ATP-binding protein [Rhodopseudomonas]|uniref:histidine kinase n=1 Tax=Rhodopseudomonas palustris TaxID=1076 RepID=A0A0D7DZV6_RHOPL|nr:MULTISPECIES: ATP-binding protein [Rhodopseudomonas]KIZ34119.1 histidine kinase [Rhodopseudomonas palustris]MDF3812717.1 sensor histidine kinase N-terminal domain-containing protein [Rhodopseudomonas sp. BAL398]WOK20736.1 sensor histidine kinase N-terminal domain-containing protein [Rhodopseudomonas sp. BAL398]